MDFFRSRNEYGSGGGSEGIEEAVPSSMSVAIDCCGCLFGCSSGGREGGRREERSNGELHGVNRNKRRQEENPQDARMSAIDSSYERKTGVLCRKLTEANDLPLLAARFPDRA